MMILMKQLWMKKMHQIRKIILNRIILEIHSDKEIDFKWKDINEEFKRINPKLNIIYLRFNKDSGHIGINGNGKWTEEFDLQNYHFTVKKCEGDNLIDFWKDHGSHFEMCVGKNKKDKRGGKPKKQIFTLKQNLKLGQET